MSDTTDSLLKGLMEEKAVTSYKQKEVADIIHPLRTELAMISDEKLRNIIGLLLTHCEMFWEAPSDNIEGYPPDEYRLGGLVQHVRRTSRSAYVLSQAWNLDREDLDILYSACILFTVCKPIYVTEDSVESIFNPHFMISFDDWFSDSLEKELLSDRIKAASLEVEEAVLSSIVRLVHCCEGAFSPIVEMTPKDPLELIFSGAHLIAKSLPFIVDGPEIIDERWDFEDE